MPAARAGPTREVRPSELRARRKGKRDRGILPL